jgi:glycine cleavage system H lipoate-binding protein
MLASASQTCAIELTDVVFVGFRSRTQAEARGQIAVVESVKAASDIYAGEGARSSK